MKLSTIVLAIAFAVPSTLARAGPMNLSIPVLVSSHPPSSTLGTIARPHGNQASSRNTIGSSRCFMPVATNLVGWPRVVYERDHEICDVQIKEFRVRAPVGA
jgi:hypothetical protein